MLSHSLFNDISDVLERWGQLLELVVAEGDVISDIALVASRIEGLLKLGLGVLKLLLLVQDAALSYDGLA